MAENQLVLAFYESKFLAERAIEAMKKWDKANDEIKLGAIGILLKDERGKVKSEKVGGRLGKSGAVLGAIAGILSGGVTLAAGAVIGGVLGSFFRKGLGMSKEDLARIDDQLARGFVAVGIVSNLDEAPQVAAKLAELGGVTETHQVTEEALEQVTEADSSQETDSSLEADSSKESDSSSEEAAAS